MPFTSWVPSLTEARYRTIDTVLKCIGVPALIVGAMWNWYTFRATEVTNKLIRQQTVRKELESVVFGQVPTLTAKMYALAAQIPLQSDDKKRQELKSDFLGAYAQFQVAVSDNRELLAVVHKLADAVESNSDSPHTQRLIRETSPTIRQELKKWIDLKVDSVAIEHDLDLERIQRLLYDTAPGTGS